MDGIMGQHLTCMFNANSCAETFYSRSTAIYVWPEGHGPMRLCTKCGDSVQFHLNKLQYDETIHRVRSGYSPDELERAVYSKLLDDTQTEMYHCQSELRRLRDLTGTLEAQEKLLKAHMAGIRSIMSPIQKLPQEILDEIFKYICCSGDTNPNWISRDEKHLPTITISRVCIRWYNLVMSTPALWSSFGTQDFGSSSTSSLFDRFLERSRFHPIDFTISDDYRSKANLDVVSSLTKSENSRRWRHVRIDAHESGKILEPLIESRGSLPVLKSLSLTFSSNSTLSFPVDFPKLQSLALNMLPLDLEYPRPSITSLSLMSLTVEETSQLISYCPNIQVLTVGQPVSDPMGLISNVRCNAMKFGIDFAFAGHLAPSQYFDNMTFPELIHLELWDTQWKRQGRRFYQILSLRSMLERSNSQLTHLTIHFMQFTPEDLLRLFICVPLVTTLEVEESEESHPRVGVRLVLKALIAPLLPQEQVELLDQAQAPENQVSIRDEGEADMDDDREDEENLDDDKDADIETPNGRCLLPCLNDLRLVIRPRSKLLLNLVRSRWRPSLLTMANPPSESDGMVCLKKLSIRYPGQVREGALRRLDALREHLKVFREEGMSVEVILS